MARQLSQLSRRAAGCLTAPWAPQVCRECGAAQVDAHYVKTLEKKKAAGHKPRAVNGTVQSDSEASEVRAGGEEPGAGARAEEELRRCAGRRLSAGLPAGPPLARLLIHQPHKITGAN